MIKKIKKNRGFVLLFAVTLTAIFLSITLGVASVALKEINFSTSAKDTNDAFFAADSGIEQALYNDKLGNYSGTTTWNFIVSGLGSSGQSCANVTVDKTASPIVTITAKGYNIGSSGGLCVSTNPNRVERELATTYTSAVSSPDTVWVEDTLPAGASPGSDSGDGWNWISSNPSPFSGSLANQSNLTSGEHQHYFTGASPTLNVNTGDTMVAYVYLDASNPPSQIELQWDSNEQGWAHRAFWNNSGTDQIGWGSQGTQSLEYIGALPATGQWVRLTVPASLVGLGGLHVNGIAFTLYGGRATWDHVGKNP
jgi:hypothetical protein